MKALWKTYITWSDCFVLQRQIAKVQEQIFKSLRDGCYESGILKNHDFLSIELAELQPILKNIEEKRPKE